VPSAITIRLLLDEMDRLGREAEAENALLAERTLQGAISPAPRTDPAAGQDGRPLFLVDGFPRNDENRRQFEAMAGHGAEFVLFFDCPHALMTERLLSRGEGRSDDTPERIALRLQTFEKDTRPVLSHFEELGRLRVVRSDRPREDVYRDAEEALVGEGW
jgi:UMP-CMP kinase